MADRIIANQYDDDEVPFPTPFSSFRVASDTLCPPLQIEELAAFALLSDDADFAKHLDALPAVPRFKATTNKLGAAALLELHKLIEPLADDHAAVHDGGVMLTISEWGWHRVEATRELFAIFAPDAQPNKANLTLVVSHDLPDEAA